MAAKSKNRIEAERLNLLAAQARETLTAHLLHTRRQLDVPTRFKSSLKAKPTAWLAGSLASGFVASLLFRRPFRRKKRREKPAPAPRSALSALLALLFTAAGPVLKFWLNGQLKHLAMRNSVGRPPF